MNCTLTMNASDVIISSWSSSLLRNPAKHHLPTLAVTHTCMHTYVRTYIRISRVIIFSIELEWGKTAQSNPKWSLISSPYQPSDWLRVFFFISHAFLFPAYLAWSTVTWPQTGGTVLSIFYNWRSTKPS